MALQDVNVSCETKLSYSEPSSSDTLQRHSESEQRCQIINLGSPFCHKRFTAVTMNMSFDSTLIRMTYMEGFS